jgi:hypothetical protein
VRACVRALEAPGTYLQDASHSTSFLTPIFFWRAHRQAFHLTPALVVRVAPSQPLSICPIAPLVCECARGSARHGASPLDRLGAAGGAPAMRWFPQAITSIDYVERSAAEPKLVLTVCCPSRLGGTPVGIVSPGTCLVPGYATVLVQMWRGSHPRACET